MDEAEIRKRCEEWLKSLRELERKQIEEDLVLVHEYVDLVESLFNAAYADGQRDGRERAAKVCEGLRHENGDYIAKQIRQAAGEVTGG